MWVHLAGGRETVTPGAEGRDTVIRVGALHPQILIIPSDHIRGNSSPPLRSLIHKGSHVPPLSNRTRIAIRREEKLELHLGRVFPLPNPMSLPTFQATALKI